MKTFILGFLVCIATTATFAQENFVSVTPSREILEKIKYADSTSSSILSDVACAGVAIGIKPFYGAGTAFRIIQCDSVKSSLLRLDKRNSQWQISMPSALLGEMEKGVIKITSFVADPVKNEVTIIFTKFSHDVEQDTYSFSKSYKGIIDEQGHWLSVN